MLTVHQTSSFPPQQASSSRPCVSAIESGCGNMELIGFSPPFFHIHELLIKLQYTHTHWHILSLNNRGKNAESQDAKIEVVGREDQSGFYH